MPELTFLDFFAQALGDPRSTDHAELVPAAVNPDVLSPEEIDAIMRGIDPDPRAEPADIADDAVEDLPEEGAAVAASPPLELHLEEEQAETASGLVARLSALSRRLARRSSGA